MLDCMREPARTFFSLHRASKWDDAKKSDSRRNAELPDEAQTLTAEGVFAPTANAFAMAFYEDLDLFAGLSGTEDFFELWEAKHFSVVSIFDDADVRDSLQRTDFKLMRTAAFSN